MTKSKNIHKQTDYAVIMAGGSGQRLWPLSRRNRPKQIIDVFGGRSLLQRCVSRIDGLFDNEHIMVVTNAEYADVVHKHLPKLPAENILGEPVGRDTANAIGLAATVLNTRGPDATMSIFSADQIIEPVEPLQDAVRHSLGFLKKHPDALLAFGIKASHAHTGFGYLKRANTPTSDDSSIYPVEAFKEKPNRTTARNYIRSGKYCWNGGMFVWRASTILKCIHKYLPENGERLDQIGQAWNTDRRKDVLASHFEKLHGISIDYGVMEHAEHVYMCQLDCHWNDVGSYQVLAETIGSADQDSNITTPETISHWMDSAKNIAISESPDHLIAAIGVEDLIIVHTPDATLICHRKDTDHLRAFLENLENAGHDRFV